MIRRLLLIGLMVSLSATAAAVEPLSSEVLLRQCGIYARDSVANEAVSCRAWVQGFIGGAFATRTAVTTDPDKKESFTERATRTRVGRGRLQFGQNYQAGYCLPATATLDEIIAGLNAYAAALERRPEQANQLMLALLRDRYPCSTK